MGYIETLEGCVLELNDTDQSVFLRNLTDTTDSLQLWKINGSKLTNKKITGKEWNITTKKTFIIVNASDKNLVIGIDNHGTIVEEEFEDGKPGRHWKKGKPDADGYFSLEGSKSSKILTANSSSNLERLEVIDSKQIWTRKKAADGFYT